MQRTTLIILLLVITFLSYEKISTKTDNHSSIIKEQVQNLLLANYRSNGKPIHELKGLLDNNKNEISIEKLLSNDYTVLFLYDTHDCDICVFSELENCKQLAEKIGSNFVKGIFQAPSPKYLDIYNKVNNVTFDLFQDLDGSVLKQFPIYSTPVLLLVDKNGIIENAFYPVKGQPSLSRPFYSYVEEKITKAPINYAKKHSH